jgi:hypothetical protein
MRELDAPRDLEQPGVHSRIGCRHVEAERFRGAVQQHRIAEWLCRCREDEQLGLAREQLESTRVALFDLADDQ